MISCGIPIASGKVSLACWKLFPISMNDTDFDGHVFETVCAFCAGAWANKAHADYC